MEKSNNDGKPELAQLSELSNELRPKEEQEGDDDDPNSLENRLRFLKQNLNFNYEEATKPI